MSTSSSNAGSSILGSSSSDDVSANDDSLGDLSSAVLKDGDDLDFTSSSIDRFLQENGLNLAEDGTETLSNGANESDKDESDNDTLTIKTSPKMEPINDTMERVSIASSSSAGKRTPPLQSPPAPPSEDSDSEDSDIEQEITQEVEEISAPTVSPDANWTQLNRQLLEASFPALEIKDQQSNPKMSSLAETIQDLLEALRDRNKTIEGMILSAEQNERNAESAEVKLSDNKRMHSASEAQLTTLEQKVERLLSEKESLTKTLKELKMKMTSDAKNWKQQLKASELRVKHREQELTRMQDKWTERVEKENKRQEVDKDRFQKLLGRKASKGRDSQALDVIRMYESQKENLEAEIRQLRKSVRGLHNDLRDKENLFNEKGSGTVSEQESKYQAEMLKRLSAAQREQEAAAHHLREREAMILKKVQRVEHELKCSHSRICDLEEENANLQLEVKSRPSVHAYRVTQRRLEKLEVKLAQQDQALAEAKDVQELRKLLDTKVLMRRDKANHKLHLNRLDAIPKSMLLEVVQHTCRLLQINDLTLIAPSIEKLCTVVTAVPRLESFVNDICAHVYEAEGKKPSLEIVVPTIKRWSSQLRDLRQLKNFRSQMEEELKQRPFAVKRHQEWEALQRAGREAPTADESGTSKGTYMSLDQMVTWASELVEMEKNWLNQKDLYEEATYKMEKRPELLINRLVHHFQYLFQVRNLQGVLPKLNATYLFVSEMEAFLEKVRPAVGLKRNATSSRCIEAVWEVLGKKKNRRRPSIAAPEKEGEPNYVVSKGEDVYGVQYVREMVLTIQALQQETGASSMEDLLPRVKRLMIMLTGNEEAEDLE